MMGRIAEALLYINEFKKINEEVFTLLSRKHLADFAGTTTESTVKLLKTLDKESIIKLKGKDIELLNKPYLEDLKIKGFPISYSKSLKRYVYNNDCELEIIYSVKLITSQEKIKISGGSLKKILHSNAIRV